MSVKLNKIIPLCIIVVLAVIGIIGYSISKSGSPVRVLFKTKGGNVIFTHKAHVSDYEIDCKDCHHETDEKVYNCRQCHSAGTDYSLICEDRPVHKQCIGANCIDCHKDMGLDEKDCKFCHR